MADEHYITSNDLCRITTMHKAWESALQRCNNPKSPSYKNWGGRGIKFEWNSFSDFYYDMWKGWDKSLSLDRIDNNGNYNLKNCRWATNKEQSRNRRSVPLVEYKGQNKSLAEWCEVLGLKASTIRQRYYGYKWPIEKCLTFNA